MMLRIRFIKPCHAARRAWSPGEEGNFTVDLASEIANLGAGEVIGPAEDFMPDPAAEKPKRARKPKDAHDE